MGGLLQNRQGEQTQAERTLHRLLQNAAGLDVTEIGSELLRALRPVLQRTQHADFRLVQIDWCLTANDLSKDTAEHLRS